MDKAQAALTPKQDRFCREYLLDLNATGAARRAGYSVATAHVQGPRLLVNVSVKQRIAALQDISAERNDVTVDNVIVMLLDSYKEAKAANQHGPAVRAAELLGKRLGMFRDRLEVSPADGQDDTVLIERLAKGDPAAAAVLTRLIGRPSFDA